MITATGLDASKVKQTTPTSTTAATLKNKTVLGKDDFMQLLLVELQHQDPTDPMDSDKILQQTSELASLESSDNTKKALENLTKSLGTSQQFSTIGAIGKTADLGSDSISLDEGDDAKATFELYFPTAVKAGTIDIKDANNNVVQTITTDEKDSGVYQFTWDGKTSTGTRAKPGVYHISANYTDQEANPQTTKLGRYPIESVRFDEGKALLKVGSNYLPLDNIKEIF